MPHVKLFAYLFTDGKTRCVQTGGVMGDGLSKHRLATAGRTKHEDATRRVDADLLVQLKVSQRQLHGLAHFLLLYVHATDVRVRHVRLLICQSFTHRQR